MTHIRTLSGASPHARIGRRLIAGLASAFWYGSSSAGAWSSSRSALAAASWGFAGRVLPMFVTHAPSRSSRCNVRGGMDQPTSRQGRLVTPWALFEFVDQAAAVLPVKSSPERSIACMITASLRATATAARLKPIFSRSLMPQQRRSLLAWLRVRITTAAL